MSDDSDLDAGRREALKDLRRLSSTILDNLLEGSRNRLIDQKELRLMGSTALRTVRLFLKTLEEERLRRVQKTTEGSAEQPPKIGQEDQT